MFSPSGRAELILPVLDSAFDGQDSTPNRTYASLTSDFEYTGRVFHDMMTRTACHQHGRAWFSPCLKLNRWRTITTSCCNCFSWLHGYLLQRMGDVSTYFWIKCIIWIYIQYFNARITFPFTKPLAPNTAFAQRLNSELDIGTQRAFNSDQAWNQSLPMRAESRGCPWSSSRSHPSDNSQS